MPLKAAPLEHFFALYVILLAALFSLGGRGAAYLGVSLSWLGEGFPLHRLHLFELNLLFLGVLSICRPRSLLNLLIQRDILIVVILAGFVLLFSHFLLGFQGNLFLFLRNSFFIWGYAFSIFLAASTWLNLRVLNDWLVYFSFLLSWLVGIVFLVRMVNEAAIEWHGLPFLFVALYFSLAGRAGRPLMYLFSLSTFALAMGYSLNFKFPRFLFIFIFMAVVLAIWRVGFRTWRAWLPKMAMLVLLIAIGFGLGSRDKKESALGTVAKAMDKSEPGRFGLDAFRWHLWRDAWEKFKERPLTGIGFENQVVWRLYVGGGREFKPNTGGWETPTSPPISGPHNSYLNAMSRIGVLGIFSLLLVLLAIWRLFRWEYYALGAICLLQFTYAIFNVGLEGPIHSLFIIIGVGCAMKARQNKKNGILNC